MRFILFVFCLFLFGCSGPGTIAIDSEFTYEEVQMIHKAIAEWVKAADSEEAFIFTLEGFEFDKEFTKADWDKDRDFGVMLKISQEEIGYKELVEERGRDFGGLANDVSGNILIVADRIAPEKFYNVVLHEFGHIHGLGHTDSGIMKQGVEIDCIHEVDLMQFCEENHCGPNAHSTCYESEEIEENEVEEFEFDPGI